MLHPSDFFDLSDSMVMGLFAGHQYVWQAIDQITWYITRLTHEKQTILGEVMPGAYISKRAIYIGEGARIEPGAYVFGPAYIGEGCVVRHGAFVRESVIMLAGSVLGHASEAKNSIFLPKAHAPHFNYVGDSILGYQVNLGAGTILSNLPMVSQKDEATGRRQTIHITVGGIPYNTGLEKLGAILGDGAQTGCNSVLNPGCLVGRRSLIYPNVSLRKGYYRPDTIIKLRQNIDQTIRE